MTDGIDGSNIAGHDDLIKISAFMAAIKAARGNQLLWCNVLWPLPMENGFALHKRYSRAKVVLRKSFQNGGARTMESGLLP